MDSLALVKQHTALAVLFVVLHHISSLPYGGRQALTFNPYANSFPYMPFYQQMYNPFQRMPLFQPMSPTPMYPMPGPPPLPVPRPAMWRYPVYNQPMPKVLSRAGSPKKRTSVIGGPLTNVVPYPSKPARHAHAYMKQKKKARMHSVAKAKSFSGILKNTALDVSKV